MGRGVDLTDWYKHTFIHHIGQARSLKHPLLGQSCHGRSPVRAFQLVVNLTAVGIRLQRRQLPA
jgi:hypothetical protein